MSKTCIHPIIVWVNVFKVNLTVLILIWKLLGWNLLWLLIVHIWKKLIRPTKDLRNTVLISILLKHRRRLILRDILSKSCIKCRVLSRCEKRERRRFCNVSGNLRFLILKIFRLKINILLYLFVVSFKLVKFLHGTNSLIHVLHCHLTLKVICNLCLTITLVLNR